jgi:hypothetical protein
MIPAYVFLVDGFLINQYDAASAIGLAHSIFGIVAEALGIWLVAEWAFIKLSSKYCAGRRHIMKVTIILWSVALGLGFLYWVLHFFYGL